MSNSTDTNPPPIDPTKPIYTLLICGNCRNRHFLSTFYSNPINGRSFLAQTCVKCGLSFILKVDEAVEHYSSAQPLIKAMEELEKKIDEMESSFN